MNPIVRMAVRALLILVAACSQQGQEKSSPTLSQLPEPLRKVLEEASSDPAFADADIALAVRGSKVAEIINSINTIPEVNRQIFIQVLRENSKLVDRPDYFVELYDLPQNKATGNIRKVSANWTPEGVLDIDGIFAAAGALKIHGHYRPVPVNTGGRIGLNVDAMTTLRGRLSFEPDVKELFAVTFNLDPASVSYSVGSSITDKKEWCWRIEYKCVGTLVDPIRTCEGRDCKILWDYEIPIVINDTIKITGTMVKLPVHVGLPDEFKVDTRVGEIEFKRAVSLTLNQIGFAADKRGLFVKAVVTIEPKALDQNPSTPKS